MRDRRGQLANALFSPGCTLHGNGIGSSRCATPRPSRTQVRTSFRLAHDGATFSVSELRTKRRRRMRHQNFGTKSTICVGLMSRE